MKLGIYSLQKVLYQGEAVSVNCKTTTGEITILDHHLPLISVLEKGTVTIIDKNSGEHYIPVSAGFLEMRSGNELRILADQENQ
ncbi:MAG: F0F1 ATP synthase subunit epsilon [Patescibacteria group bacterium]|nr:F0F1 ATP synthase subunit epsilon [Patescibacteria group bacterium]